MVVVMPEGMPVDNARNEERMLSEIVDGWHRVMSQLDSSASGIELTVDQDSLLAPDAGGRMWHLYFESGDKLAEALAKAPFDYFAFTDNAGYFEIEVLCADVPRYVLDELGGS